MKCDQHSKGQDSRSYQNNNYIVAQVRQKGQDMYYKKLSNEELNKCKFPNLIAEIIESGYSTSTLADFMGLGAKKNGKYRKEDDPEVWNKINGQKEMLASHIVGLAKYYGVKIEYLSSYELTIQSGKPLAYWRWYENNQKKKKELERLKTIGEIEYTLYSEPYLLEFMKCVIGLKLKQEQLRELTEYMMQKGTTNT